MFLLFKNQILYCRSPKLEVTLLGNAFWDGKISDSPLPVLTEVQIKVQLFDNSDLSPLANAQVEVHGNQSAILASGRADSDGVVRVGFLYRTGTSVIITASKQNYVTNSVPWHSSRIPCEKLPPLCHRMFRCSAALVVNVCFWVYFFYSVRISQPVPARSAARNADSVR